MKKLSLLLLLCACCFALPTLGQQNLVISGTVNDSTSGPISGHTVYILHDSTFFFNYSNIVTTNANGDYIDTILLPQTQTQGLVYVYVFDCNQLAHTQTISYSPGNYSINNVDFLICGGTSASSCMAQFSASPNPGSTLISFTDLSTASSGITSWYWDFGDGNTSTLQNPNHAYNSVGPFVVCLTITTANCSDTTCQSVTVGSGTSCNVNLTATATQSLGSFSASASGTGTPVSYAWDFGDGGSATTTGSSTSHTYTSNGTYTACVTTFFSDSCWASDCQTVVIGTVQSFCNAGFTFGYQGTFGGFTSNSTASGTILSYSWDFGDGSTATTTSGSVAHSYSGTGPWLACLTITTSDTCTSTFCDSVSLNSSSGCQAGFVHFPDTTGQYTILAINTSQGTGLSYFWDFGDNTSSTQQFPIHQYAGPGTYLICLTITGGPACSSTFCDSVTVTQKMASAFTFAVVDPTATSVDPSQATGLSMDLWPNPANDQVSIRLESESSSKAGLQILDLHGRTVLDSGIRNISAGEHTFRVSVEGLPAGMYLARLSADDQIIVKKLLIE